MEIFGVGLPELLVIAVVALIVLGPERLPEAARTLGKAVAEVRRAIEPARSAWTDLTNELNTAVNSATTVSTGQQHSKPWEMHPVLAQMSTEEREAFIKGGEMPKHILEEMNEAAKNGHAADSNATVPLAQLDYPMPHEQPKQQAAQRPTAQEELSYPEPGSARSKPQEEEA